MRLWQRAHRHVTAQGAARAPSGVGIERRRETRDRTDRDDVGAGPQPTAVLGKELVRHKEPGIRPNGCQYGSARSPAGPLRGGRETGPRVAARLRRGGARASLARRKLPPDELGSGEHQPGGDIRDYSIALATERHSALGEVASAGDGDQFGAVALADVRAGDGKPDPDPVP